MIQSLLTHIIFKIFRMLMRHRDFLSLPEGQKRAILKEFYTEHDPFFDYLLKADEQGFLTDLKELLPFLKTPLPREATLPATNMLAVTIGYYIAGPLAELLDKIPASYFALNMDQKLKWLNDELKAPAILAGGLSVYNAQELFQELHLFLRAIDPSTPFLVVQMAVETEADTRKQIRAHYFKEHRFAFPYFQVIKQLYGGMRVLKNGKLIDNSWLGMIERVTSGL
jgi:hypothetical protein